MSLIYTVYFMVVVEPDKSQGGKLAIKSFSHIRDIRLSLEQQPTWHDLCLFRVGIDSVLRGRDLLRVSVSDVQYHNQQLRQGKSFKQSKNQTSVYMTLSPVTLSVCAKWIRQSGKSGNDFLFTGCDLNSKQPLSISSLQRRVKRWAEGVGLNPEDYSSRSLRKTKPYHLYHYWRVQLEKISILLGHKDIRSTMHYIGILQEEVERIALACDVFDPYKTLPQSPVESFDKDTLIQSLHDTWAMISDVVIDQLADGVHAKITPWMEAQFNTRFAHVDTRFTQMDTRLEALIQQNQALFRLLRQSHDQVLALQGEVLALRQDVARLEIR